MNAVFDNKVSLYVQVKNGIIKRIRTGEMPPNSKVPSERDLARRYNISRGTAKQALQELEAESYIERIPAKGSFVRDITNEPRRLFNILFPFPEVAISRDVLDYAGFAADMEMYRGMMSSCDKYGARITFQHIPEISSRDELRTQVRGISDFDGAVFFGHQLADLRSELRKHGIPCVTICDGDKRIAGTTVEYNRNEIVAESANHIADAGVQSVGMFASEAGKSLVKENICASIFEERGVEFQSKWILKIENDEEKAYRIMKKLLPEDAAELPDLFYAVSQVYSFAFLRLAVERGWRVPEDVGIFGYANNTDLRPTTPMLSHVRVPYFEMGREACRVLTEGLRGEFIVPARIVEGETVMR
jgi:DNA-binding LacI/PurR family transcriptional regulator